LFVLSHLQNANHHVFYHPQADMECEGAIFEIGGKDKKTTQVKNLKNAYLVKDDILIGGPQTVPLYLFGFLF
jgi:hypothetical protein